MKKSLFVLASIACLGALSFGCGDDETVCDGYTCEKQGFECVVGTAPLTGTYAKCQPTKELCVSQYGEGAYYDEIKDSCVPADMDDSCKKDSDCDEANNEYCNLSTGFCEQKQSAGYRYVMIEDLSSAEDDTKEDPGADIDAVVIKPSNGDAAFYIADVVAYTRSSGGSTKKDDEAHAFDPDAIVGAPDAIVDYTAAVAGADKSATCKYYANSEKTKFTFVSLGGRGGYVIGQLEADAHNGDSIYVTEIGNCKLANTKSADGKVAAGAEAFSVKLSVAKEQDSDWHEVINTEGVKNGVISATIANLK